MPRRPNSLAATLTLACMAVLTVSKFDADAVYAGTPVYVGDAKASLVPMHEIRHTLWSQLLHKFVDGNGRVNYAKWHSSPADLAILDRYLDHLSTASLSNSAETNPSHALAFWINAYNAVTVKGILREYPTTSIRNHTPKLWGYHIWHDLKLYVGHKPFSLDEIEHQVLRKLGEPRIHFAIVCASIGCPRLLNEAYQSDRVDQQLTTNANDFFSRPQNFRFDIAKQRFELSAILDWFGEDFGNDQSQLLKRISPWLPTQSAREAALQGSVGVTFLDYDWNLNSQ